MNGEPISKPRVSLQALLEMDSSTVLEGRLKKLHEKELLRVEKLWAEEHKIWQDQPGAVVIGSDEVGRGPLAGPLVAAAVAFKEPLMQVGINDSKKLSHEEREALFERLQRMDLHYSISIITHQQISNGNLHLLSLQAIESAVRSLKIAPHLVLIDGKHPMKCSDLPQRAIIGGDRLCASIAAASIMAKVTRDRLMLKMDKKYPGYNFAQNKGYGTADHMQALRTLGPCPIHRMNFAPVRAHANEQLELFKQKRISHLKTLHAL